MPDYKFLRSEHLPALLGGSVRLGSLGYYRLLEGLSGDDWIGDKSEARVNAQIADGLYTAPGGGHIRFTNCTPLVTGDGYVFSFSRGDFDPLSALFQQSRPGMDGYSGCVRVLDADRLRHALARGTIANGALAGSTLHSLGRVELQEVTYKDSPPLQLHPFGALPKGNPFLKSAKFSTQSEVRICVQCETPTDALTIQIEDADEIFSVVSIGLDPPVAAHRTVQESFEEASQIMRAGMTTAEEKRRALSAYAVLRMSVPDNAVDIAIAADIPDFFVRDMLEGYLSMFQLRYRGASG